MWRLLLSVSLLATMLWPRPAAAQDECPAAATTPEETVSTLFGEYLANGQWDLAYEVLHPEAQLRLAYPVFASVRQADAAFTPLVDVEVFPARVAPGWTWGLTGLSFTNVAEVPVRFVRGTVAGTLPTIEVVPLVHVGDCWRWLPALP